MIVRSHFVRARMWWLAALACAGVAVTHALSYRLVADGSARAELLHETGHDLWPPFVVFAVVALAVLGFGGWLSSPASTAGSRSVLRTAGRLGALQGGVWMAVEVAERAAFSHGHLSWRSLAPVVVGLGVQAVVALVGAFLLALLAEVAAFVRARRRTVWPRRTAASRAVQLFLPAEALLRSAASPRGPPLSTLT